MVSTTLKLPKECVFCGSSGPMSREHTFARWMTEFIPVSDLKNHEIVSVKHTPGLGQMPPENRRRNSGPPTSRRQKIVCVSCNSGWMSRLEEDVKPVLGPMMAGASTVLSPDEQRLLARWIDKTIIVYEFEFPDNAATTARQRRAFPSLHSPSEATRVWIGHFTGASDYPRPRHHTWGEFGPDKKSPLLQRVDTITMGKVLFYVTSASSLAYQVEDYPASAVPQYLAQIWPNAGELSWPPERAIHGLQHRWLADWRRTDLKTEEREWPTEVPRFKVDPAKWMSLPDVDDEGDPRYFPLSAPGL